MFSAEQLENIDSRYFNIITADEKGVLVPTEEVHHKKPLSEGGTHDRENLIALCKSCHSTIHAHRGDYWNGR